MLLPDTATHCPLHGDPLREELVPIIYGLRRFSAEYTEASNAHFPRSNFHVGGGCGVGREFLYQAMVCDRCRQAHVAWCGEMGCTEGLPRSAENLDYFVYRHFDAVEFDGVLPPEALILVDTGKLVAAAKLLKQANPRAEMPEIRANLRFLQRRHEIAALRERFSARALHDGLAELWQQNLPHYPPSATFEDWLMPKPRDEPCRLHVQVSGNTTATLEPYTIYVNGNIASTPADIRRKEPARSEIIPLAVGKHRVVVREAEVRKPDRAESNTVWLDFADDQAIGLRLDIDGHALVLVRDDTVVARQQ